MNSFTPTTNTQAALQAALQDASAKGNPDIRPAHLLVALLEQEDSISQPVLEAAGVNVPQLLSKARDLTASYPQATGSDMANPQFNRDALNALTASQELASELGDTYVSTEVLLAGIAKGDSDAAKLMHQAGATYEAVRGAFESVRGNRKVTTEEPEGQFQALEKYSQDLTARAREGKIDPVIGRDQEIRRVVQVLSCLLYTSDAADE